MPSAFRMVAEHSSGAMMLHVVLGAMVQMSFIGCEGNKYFSLACGCKYATSGLRCKGNMHSRVDKRGSADISGSEENFGHKFFVEGKVNFSYNTARCSRWFHTFRWLALVLQYCTAEYLGLCSVMTWVLMSVTNAFD